MLSEGSSVKGSPEDKQPSGPCIKGSAKISRRVTLAHHTGEEHKGTCAITYKHAWCLKTEAVVSTTKVGICANLFLSVFPKNS